MYGCHSDLDKYKEIRRTVCEFPMRHTEKACDGCERVGCGEAITRPVSHKGAT
jgi:hypothetical protein